MPEQIILSETQMIYGHEFAQEGSVYSLPAIKELNALPSIISNVVDSILYPKRIFGHTITDFTILNSSEISMLVHPGLSVLDHKLISIQDEFTLTLEVDLATWDPTICEFLFFLCYDSINYPKYKLIAVNRDDGSMISDVVLDSTDHNLLLGIFEYTANTNTILTATDITIQNHGVKRLVDGNFYYVYGDIVVANVNTIIVSESDGTPNYLIHKLKGINGIEITSEIIDNNEQIIIGVNNLDSMEVDYTPTNYETTDILPDGPIGNALACHLKGIDDALSEIKSNLEMAESEYQIDNRTLDNNNIINKIIYLDHEVELSKSDEMFMIVHGGIVQQCLTDFAIMQVDSKWKAISWDGYNADGLLKEGQNVSVHYFAQIDPVT
jgi:hypothetical protein